MQLPKGTKRYNSWFLQRASMAVLKPRCSLFMNLAVASASSAARPPAPTTGRATLLINIKTWTTTPPYHQHYRHHDDHRYHSFPFSSQSSSLSTNSITVRSRFKETPVHPSILAYIKRVGIGRMIRKDNRHQRKRPFLDSSKGSNTTKNSNSNNNNTVMSRGEEEHFLDGGLHSNYDRRRRTGKVHVKSYGQTSTSYNRSLSLSPPPPFGDPRREIITTNKRREGNSKPKQESNYPGDSSRRSRSMSYNVEKDTTATINRNIRILPVKLLGSVTTNPATTTTTTNNSFPKNYIVDNTNNNNNTDGSSMSGNINISSSFPRPSKGLPEIAVIGRSNVGKSTLINALLYGGRSIHNNNTNSNNGRTTNGTTSGNNNQRRKRGTTSQTAKLHKGLKAKISSKPGETRSIDFYQLSAKISESSSSSSSSFEDDSDGNSNSVNYPRGKKRSSNKNTNISTNRNFFKEKGGKKMSLLLVDLPGYGFAYGPKTTSNKSNNNSKSTTTCTNNNNMVTHANNQYPWQSLIETYILDRPRTSLKRVLLLIDARHGMKRADIDFLVSLQATLTRRYKDYCNDSSVGSRRGGSTKNHISSSSSSSSSSIYGGSTVKVESELPPLQIVLTKCDLVSQHDLARRIVLVRQQLSDCLVRQPKLLPEMLVSAQMEGRLGVLELQKELSSLCKM